MPWQTLGPMNQKIELIATYQRKDLSLSELSRKFGVSRKTVPMSRLHIVLTGQM
jgi:predicted DNA-binding protein YlxM (UPF0122 family)